MTATTSHPTPSQVGTWIASPRFALFLDAATLDHRAALELYVWNARLASASNEVIHHVEVLVRNAIHHELKLSQLEDGLRSWLVDPDVLRSAELNAVTNVITRTRRRGKRVTDNRVVAGLPLGFWSRMVGTGYDELWSARLHRAFEHGGGNRKVDVVLAQDPRAAALRALG